MKKDREIIDISDIHIEILTAMNGEDLLFGDNVDNLSSDADLAEQLDLTIEELEEQLIEGINPFEAFFKITGLDFITKEKELGDIDKAYWEVQIVFKRLSDNKYFAADYTESDRAHWGGFQEVSKLIEVDRKEKQITLVTYE